MITEDGTLTLPYNVNITGDLNVDGNGLIKNKLTVGTASGRKMVIQPSSFGTEQTYLAFFNGDTRTSYMCPYTDGKVGFSNNVGISGNLNVGGGLTVNEDINMKASKSIRCDGRLHIFTNERLYLLAVDNTWITSDWGGDGNLNVTGSLTANGSCSVGDHFEAGVNSGRKIRFNSSNYESYQTFIEFYNGTSRTNYILPYTNGNIFMTGHIETNGNLKVAGSGTFANTNVRLFNQGWPGRWGQGGGITLHGDNPTHGKKQGIYLSAYYENTHGNLWRRNLNGSYYQVNRW